MDSLSKYKFCDFTQDEIEFAKTKGLFLSNNHNLFGNIKIGIFVNYILISKLEGNNYSLLTSQSIPDRYADGIISLSTFRYIDTFLNTSLEKIFDDYIFRPIDDDYVKFISTTAKNNYLSDYLYKHQTIQQFEFLDMLQTFVDDGLMAIKKVSSGYIVACNKNAYKAGLAYGFDSPTCEFGHVVILKGRIPFAFDNEDILHLRESLDFFGYKLKIDGSNFTTTLVCYKNTKQLVYVK